MKDVFSLIAMFRKCGCVALTGLSLLVGISCGERIRSVAADCSDPSLGPESGRVLLSVSAMDLPAASVRSCAKMSVYRVIDFQGLEYAMRIDQWTQRLGDSGIERSLTRVLSGFRHVVVGRAEPQCVAIGSAELSESELHLERLEFGEGKTMSGVVVGVDGHPIGSAKVVVGTGRRERHLRSVFGGLNKSDGILDDREDETRADGSFRIDGLVPWSWYQVEVEKVGCALGVARVVAGLENSVTVVMRPSSRISIEVDWDSMPDVRQIQIACGEYGIEPWREIEASRGDGKLEWQEPRLEKVMVKAQFFSALNDDLGLRLAEAFRRRSELSLNLESGAIHRLRIVGEVIRLDE